MVDAVSAALLWVSEAFHARFPVYREHVSADETKLPFAREKKPLVPRVLLQAFLWDICLC